MYQNIDFSGHNNIFSGIKII